MSQYFYPAVGVGLVLVGLKVLNGPPTAFEFDPSPGKDYGAQAPTVTRPYGKPVPADTKWYTSSQTNLSRPHSLKNLPPHYKRSTFEWDHTGEDPYNDGSDQLVHMYDSLYDRDGKYKVTISDGRAPGIYVDIGDPRATYQLNLAGRTYRTDGPHQTRPNEQIHKKLHIYNKSQNDTRDQRRKPHINKRFWQLDQLKKYQI